MQAPVTIQYREFGVRLRFAPNILSDSVITLYVRPEVSSLDYSNAVTLSGFRIPALRTRRVESSVDIRRDQSVILSGLFNEERERVRSGLRCLSRPPTSEERTRVMRPEGRRRRCPRRSCWTGEACVPP